MVASCSSSAGTCCRAEVSTHLLRHQPGGCSPLRAAANLARHQPLAPSRLRFQAGCSSSLATHCNASHRILSTLQRGDAPAGLFGDDVLAGQWDVIGLGQAMVDFSAEANDELLERQGVAKGSRRLISVEERGTLLSELDGSSYTVTAGGSLANSLVALSKLGVALSSAGTGRRLRVAMAGPVGRDALGSFFVSQMEQAGVAMLTTAPADSNTGTVIVLTTADAQRTFLSYLGSDQTLATTSDPGLAPALGRTRLLVVEGYLWELPGAAEAIGAAVAAARASGALVALTCGAAGVVERHASSILPLLEAGMVDVLFANKEEAQQLLQAWASPGAGAAAVVASGCAASSEALLPAASEPAAAAAGAAALTVCQQLPQRADDCAMQLGSRVPVSVVTDGANGATVAALGHLHIIPPCWKREPPRDTNGAGDAWAAGFLFGLLTGAGVSAAGKVGARVASEVISRPGAGLTSAEARSVIAASASCWPEGTVATAAVHGGSSAGSISDRISGGASAGAAVVARKGDASV